MPSKRTKITSYRKKGVYATNPNILKRAVKKKLMKPMRRVSKFYSKIEPCTKKYAMSLIDPTSEHTRGACVPQGFPMPSQKVRAFIRGVVTTNTTGSGLGYLLFYPALANDAVCVRATTGGANAAVSTTPLNNALYPTANNAISKLPYSTAQLTAGVIEARFISGCIRVRYSGKESTRAGSLTLLETPDHEDIYPLSYADINQYEAATTTRPTGEGEWAQINWSGPAKSAELNYTNFPVASGTLNTVTGVYTPAAPIVIFIGGGDSTIPQTYDYEAWVNIEYIGKVAVGKTPGDIDAVGFGKVQQAVKNIVSTEPLMPGIADKVMSAVEKAVGFTQSQAGQSIINTISRSISRGRSPALTTRASSTSGPYYRSMHH